MLNQGLAYGVGALRINAGLLSYVIFFRKTIYTAGRHINEAFYSRFTGKLGEMNRSFVVDFVSNGWRQLSSGIIGEFGHVNDGIHVLQVLHLDVTKVLGQRQRCHPTVPIERAIFIEASVQANDLVALAD